MLLLKEAEAQLEVPSRILCVERCELSLVILVPFRACHCFAGFTCLEG